MDNRKIGCLWEKESQNGKTFWSGELLINGQKVSIVGFKRDKRNEKEPDIDLLKSLPQEGLKI